ncbi:FxsB family cyclophane-forming radical SAM/SPASM peptide maturase [Actinocorallia longicatena]|uniref:FxsB family cyclophane-forming radical SAM/SPASM peptide maturase n=1 Tax=Actinocorallia longicatena TaxID=111803 RepID=UPI0031E41085
MDLTTTGPNDEWPTGLDVGELRRSGWNPIAFRVFVVKIHSRCDLACRYCYMYTLADQSWADKPARMSPETAAWTARRIAEHAETHGLTSVEVVLHGGEPLLAGPGLIRDLVEGVRAACRCRVDVTVQTNGLRLDEEYLDLFDALGVRVGVSLDGDASANDRHRVFRDGRPSHRAVTRSLHRMLDGHRHLFAGLLSTVDLRNDPIGTYESLLEFGPPAVDFLLPHGTWTDPPPGRPGDASTPYADWLIPVFDRWYRAPRTTIRLFAEIMHLLLGGASTIETIGLSPCGVLVVETDGGIEQSDFLKAAYDGAPLTGLHVASDPFDVALELPGVAARQIGLAALADECLSCPVVSVCGGGLYAHRYRAGAGFRNPSVYCADLFALIGHIRRTMERDVEMMR